jgi:phosphohistidine phosphatase
MRRLMLLRHAVAEPSEPGLQDRVRVLVERGRKDAGKIGAYMAGHGFTPERALVSPAARTQETWKYVAAGFHSPPAGTPAPELYDATPHAIFGLIKAAPASAMTLLLVGHNPGLHEAAATLVATGDIDTRARLREKLPTAGLVIIEFAFDDWAKLHPQSGRLERFVSPKWLEAATN